MNRAQKKDIQSAVVIIIFAVLFYAFSFKIQATTSDVLGSRFFPQVTSILLVVLSLVLIVRSITVKEELTEDQLAKIEKSDRINQPLILTSVLLFAYYFLLRGIGFVITSILYLMGASWVLMPEADRKNKRMLILAGIVSIVVPIFLNTVFYKVFNIKLPSGSLF